MNEAEKPPEPEYSEGAELTGIPAEEFDWTDHEHDRLDEQAQTNAQLTREKSGTETADDGERREIAEVRKRLASNPSSPRPRRRIHVQFSDTTDEAAKKYREGTGEGESFTRTDKEITEGAAAAQRMFAELERSRREHEEAERQKGLDRTAALLRGEDPDSI